jgi:hypothetical protein
MGWLVQVLSLVDISCCLALFTDSNRVAVNQERSRISPTSLHRQGSTAKADAALLIVAMI